MGQEGVCESGDKPTAHDVLSTFRQGWRAKLRSPSKKPEPVPDSAIMQEPRPVSAEQAESTITQEPQAEAKPNDGVPQPQSPANKTAALYEVDLDPSSDDCPADDVAQQKRLPEDVTPNRLVDEPPSTWSKAQLQSTKIALEEQRSASGESAPASNKDRQSRELSRSRDHNVDLSAKSTKIALEGQRSASGESAPASNKDRRGRELSRSRERKAELSAKSTKTALEEQRSASGESAPASNNDRQRRKLSRSRERNAELSTKKPRILLIGRRNTGRKNALTSCNLQETNQTGRSLRSSPSHRKSPPVRPRHGPSTSKPRSSSSHPRSSSSRPKSSASHAHVSRRTAASSLESLGHRQSQASSQPESCCEESNATSHQDVLPRKKLVTKKRKKRRIKRRRKKDEGEKDVVKHKIKRRHHVESDGSPPAEELQQKHANGVSNSEDSGGLAPSSNRSREAPDNASEDSSCKEDVSEQDCVAEVASERKGSHSDRSESVAVERESSPSEVLKRSLKRKRVNSPPRSSPKDKRCRRTHRGKFADASKSASPEWIEDVAVDRCRAAALQAFGLAMRKKSADAKGRPLVVQPELKRDEIPLKRRAALRAFGMP